MATAVNRWEVVKRLVEMIANHADIGVAKAWPVWPGDRFETDEMFVADEIVGESSVPSMKAGRHYRDDEFTVTFKVKVASSKSSFDDTMARLFALVSIVDDVVAESSTLEDLDGVVSAVVSANRQWPVSTPEGALGFAEVSVSVHSRLQ